MSFFPQPITWTPGSIYAAVDLLLALQTILSFDRPVEYRTMVANARDAMLEAGFPTANDFRPRGSRDSVEAARKEIGEKT